MGRFESEIDGIPTGPSRDNRRVRGQKISSGLAEIRDRQRQDEEREKLRYLSYHDRLTGLPNDRAFSEAFEHAVQTASSTNEELGLAITDLDGLKRVNDEEGIGHDGGHELLKAAARTLQNSTRPQDEVFRIGGDEYAVLFPGFITGTEPDQTEETAELGINERYKGAFSNEITTGVLTEAQQEKVQAGLTTGFSILRKGESAREFFRRVDGKLQKNKKEGRDRLAKMGFVFRDERLIT